MIMSEIFGVDLDYLKEREIEDDQPVVKVEFSGKNTIHAVWLTLDQSEKLAARLREVSAELSRLRTMLRKRAR
jgi:hypothetical protein